MFMPDWTCPTCGRFTILGGDISQASYDMQQRRIAEHTGHHAAQLAEHDGDEDALARRLQTPAVHAALTQIQEQP
jgi:hypothetical protein